jgi:hypothetical protein
MMSRPTKSCRVAKQPDAEIRPSHGQARALSNGTVCLAVLLFDARLLWHHPPTTSATCLGVVSAACLLITGLLVTNAYRLAKRLWL